MAAGYSGTQLIKKLGIKPEMKLLLVNAPAEYMTWLDADISNQLCNKGERADFIHVFITRAAEVLSELLSLKKQMHAKTILWVSWYKKSAKMPSDVSEDTIRNTALQNGLVDTKVCAVNDQWSGLKLVVPVSERSAF